MSKWEGLPYGPGRRLIEPRGRSGRRYVLGAALVLLVMVGVLGNPLQGGEVSGPSAAPSPTSRLAAARPSVPAPTASPTIAPTSAPSPTPQSEILMVDNTGGLGVYVRRAPGSDDRIRAWPEKTLMVVVGPDQDVQGRKWRNVRDPSGNVGWVPAEFLAVPPATPTPRAGAVWPVSIATRRS